MSVPSMLGCLRPYLYRRIFASGPERRLAPRTSSFNPRVRQLPDLGNDLGYERSERNVPSKVPASERSRVANPSVKRP